VTSGLPSAGARIPIEFPEKRERLVKGGEPEHVSDLAAAPGEAQPVALAVGTALGDQQYAKPGRIDEVKTVYVDDDPYRIGALGEPHLFLEVRTAAEIKLPSYPDDVVAPLVAGFDLDTAWRI
jgi:hypothetical protein